MKLNFKKISENPMECHFVVTMKIYLMLWKSGCLYFKSWIVGSTNSPSHTLKMKIFSHTEF